MLGFNGGLLGKRRVPTIDAASGLWFLNEQSIAKRAGIWYSDPSWNSVLLLLHMDGSNNSTTFTDSSSYNLTVSVSGNAKISTARWPFSGSGSSGSFAAEGDRLVVTMAEPVGSGNWTAETWIYLASLSTFATIFTFNDYRLASGLVLYIAQNGKIAIYTELDGTGTIAISGTTAIATEQWHHLAWVKFNSVITQYVNGTVDGSVSHTQNLSSEIIRIGSANYYNGNYGAGSGWVNGNLSNMRITKGVARYTANFTPPTAPFPDA